MHRQPILTFLQPHVRPAHTRFTEGEEGSSHSGKTGSQVLRRRNSVDRVLVVLVRRGLLEQAFPSVHNDDNRRVVCLS
jgi:hypothetical protein